MPVERPLGARRTPHEELMNAISQASLYVDEGPGPIRRWKGLYTVEVLFTLFALMFMTGGLTRTLTGNLPEDVAISTSSPLVQASGAGIYVLTIGFIALRAQRFLPLIIRNLILFLPVIMALASTAWSADPDMTMRRSISLFGTSALGLYVGLRFGLKEIANLLFTSLTIIVGLSFLAAVLVPTYGVHQPSDPLTGHHAGLWRGLYWHKNVLGPCASILVLITLSLWRQIVFWRLIKLAVFGIASIVVLKAGSSQAMFQFTIFTALILAHLRFSKSRASLRVALFSIGLTVAFPVFMFREEITAFGLELLNRDATLSSRIYIWHAAILGGLKAPIIGIGYEVGWRFGAAHIYALQLYYIDVGHAHNGFLQTWLDLGFVGIGLVVCVWVVFLYRTFAVAKYSYEAYMLSLYFLLYYFMTNYVTSFLMKYQDIYWLVISIMFVCMSKIMLEIRRNTEAATGQLHTQPA